MRLYPMFFRLAFSGMDPERAHHLGFLGIRLCRSLGVSAVLRRLCGPGRDQAVEVMGLRFPSRFGLAAGFDKGAQGSPRWRTWASGTWRSAR